MVLKFKRGEKMSEEDEDDFLVFLKKEQNGVLFNAALWVGGGIGLLIGGIQDYDLLIILFGVCFELVAIVTCLFYLSLEYIPFTGDEEICWCCGRQRWHSVLSKKWDVCIGPKIGEGCQILTCNNCPRGIHRKYPIGIKNK